MYREIESRVLFKNRNDVVQYLFSFSLLEMRIRCCRVTET